MQHIRLPVESYEDDNGIEWRFSQDPGRQFVIDWVEEDREDTLVFATKFSISDSALFFLEGEWHGKRPGDDYATRPGPGATFLIAAVPSRRWNKITERPLNPRGY